MGKQRNEVGKGIREDVEMRENGERMRVLGEVDHNSMSLQQELPTETKKSGSWKRKINAKGNKCRRDQGEGEGKENVGSRTINNRKRGFCLVDEEKLMADPIQIGKKKDEVERGGDAHV